MKFRIIYEKILKMREELEAPVDTMGCHVHEKPFFILISCLISSQTTDYRNFVCMTKIKNEKLTIKKINKLQQNEVEKLLQGVSFYKTKARYLKEICKILIQDFDSQVPGNFTDLISFPGIGSKMANLILTCAFNVTRGLAVDVHVNRICNRLGLIDSKNAQKSAEFLENLVPLEIWPDFNRIFVGFGQKICSSRKPKCQICPVQKLCVFFKKNKI